MRMGVTGVLASLVVVAGVMVAPAAGAAPGQDDRARGVVDHWTADRLAAAEARDLVVDERGLGYERRGNGRLTPHGHGTAAAVPAPTVVPTSQPSEPEPTPRAKPAGDRTGPSISGMSPAAATTIGTTQTFSATVSDPSGVRSVTFVVTPSGGTSSTFPGTASGSTWSVTLQGFTPGQWSWSVRATDTKGNQSTSPTLAFTVGESSPPPPPDASVVANAAWTEGGPVQTAAGRIYFEMPTSKTLRTWSGYVCSGTVVQDSATDRSIILTAAHCVYDDVNKAFARNVLFIPNQAGTTGAATDKDCTNDPLGCWAPSYGVVDSDWTTRTFPNNVAWDYAFYVVPGTGAHSGTATSSESLETVAGRLPVSFDQPLVDVAGANTDRTTALGYSYSDDPHFMYCAEDMTTKDTANWWLPNCGLSGGASGGPWVQPMAGGSGPIVSVNSWGYTNQPGMAGPKLWGSSAQALLAGAQTGTATSTGGSALPVS